MDRAAVVKPLPPGVTVVEVDADTMAAMCTHAREHRAARAVALAELHAAYAELGVPARSDDEIGWQACFCVNTGTSPTEFAAMSAAEQYALSQSFNHTPPERRN